MKTSDFRAMRVRTKHVALMALSILFGCDQKVTDGGSGDETSTVAFYRADGRPAAGARVSIYGSSDTGVAPRKQVVTDANGNADLPTPDKGFYNLVVRDRDGNALFQDSLFSDGLSISATPDTLRATGVLTGRLAVQPQHSPRIAWVQLLGAGVWVNVDDSGRFRIEGVPAGRFTIAALTRTEGYTPTFAQVKTISDSTVDAGIIELVYTGLPVVKNLQARFDTLAGMVHLRWDSTALRQTWHYNVYRDDILLGQTTGPRWIDTVLDEYPGNVPSQGLHAYRVALANADSVGPRWESITMRIISAYLYQEVKIDWEKRSELPWPSGLFRIDTADGKLVGWRSAEYGTKVFLPGISYPFTNIHRGEIEMWISADTGRTWIRNETSLRLGALPVRYRGKWWSIRSSKNRVEPDSALISRYSSSAIYSSAIIETSVDGVEWDSAYKVDFPNISTSWRFEITDMNLILVGGCEVSGCDEFSMHGYTFDMNFWSMQDTGWKEYGYNGVSSVPSQIIGPSNHKIFWSEKWWTVYGTYSVSLNGIVLPDEGLTSFDFTELPQNNCQFPVDLGKRVIFFGYKNAVSMDSAGSILHSVSWPVAGKHFEMKLGKRILSVSDSGVYLGRILSGIEGGDPRGTWVKQAEIPVQY